MLPMPKPQITFQSPGQSLTWLPPWLQGCLFNARYASQIPVLHFFPKSHVLTPPAQSRNALGTTGPASAMLSPQHSGR